MSQPSLILFDGPCTLCNKSVQWVAKRDTKDLFQFGSLQGNWARKNVPESYLLEDTVVLVRQGKYYTRSTAAILILSTLPFWKWTAPFLAIPVALRDFIYRWVARNRHQWFGTGYCALLPNEKLLDSEPDPNTRSQND